jgi:hypothetical protein
MRAFVLAGIGLEAIVETTVPTGASYTKIHVKFPESIGSDAVGATRSALCLQQILRIEMHNWSGILQTTPDRRFGERFDIYDGATPIT